MISCFSCFHFDGTAQKLERFNSFSYNVNEGLLQTSINDIGFDNNNFFWISFPNGIQKFDGKNFSSVPVQPGLADDKGVNFFRSSNGDFLISHSKGISNYKISNNRFQQVYDNPRATQTPVLFIGEDENLIFVYSYEG